MNPRSRGTLQRILIMAAVSFMGTEIGLRGEDASALIARVLTTNSPWLKPKPAYGTYRLRVSVNGGTDGLTGLSLLEKESSNSWKSFGPCRVGSLVWTPLHVMAHAQAPYTVSSLGRTNWEGTNLEAVEVNFSSNTTCMIGLGGQRNISYASAGYHQIRTAHLFIEPLKAVPIFMDSHSATNVSQLAPTWRFDPIFFQVDGGSAPRSLDWYEHSIFSEHQEFQIVNSVWLFASGSSSSNVRVELTDLSIPLQLTRSPVLTNDGLLFRWTSTAGRSYRVQSTTDLSAPNWMSTSEPFYATDTWSEVELPRPAANRTFFRVEQSE